MPLLVLTLRALDRRQLPIPRKGLRPHALGGCIHRAGLYAWCEKLFTPRDRFSVSVRTRKGYALGIKNENMFHS